MWFKGKEVLCSNCGFSVVVAMVESTLMKLARTLVMNSKLTTLMEYFTNRSNTFMQFTV